MTAEIHQKLSNISQYLIDNGLSQAYLSSYDSFLGEYVPPKNSLRVPLTNFTGSVAEVLIRARGKHDLFIDGRYTEQAKKQVDQNLFNIHTSAQGQRPFSHMLELINKEGASKLGYIPARTSFSDFKTLKSTPGIELEVIKEATMMNIAGVSYEPVLSPIQWVSPENGGVETQKKIQSLRLEAHEAYFITALDSLAWLVNARGYHFPYLSSFAGSGIVTQKLCYVFIQEKIELESDWKQIKDIVWIKFKDTQDYKKQLLNILKVANIHDLKFDPQYVNSADFDFLNQQCQLESFEPINLLLTQYHSLKYPEEIHTMKDDFLKASKAIFETISYVKENWENMSEKDVFYKTSEFYKKYHAKGQSFKTIAGFAGNGSIIHYGSPDDQLALKSGEIFLLDSGAYFESGFATDKTRTFLIGDKPSKDLYKEIYTLVLKGLLNLQNASFEEGTGGKELDAIARKPLQDKGYDYAHGTGHGVGVHVHEGGVRIHMSTPLTMKEHQVVSIEPGIYLPEIAGVRLENIAYIVKDTESGKLKFKNLVYIGYDHDLIDMNLLSEQEKTWLDDYERQCQNLGTSFKYKK